VYAKVRNVEVYKFVCAEEFTAKLLQDKHFIINGKQATLFAITILNGPLAGMWALGDSGLNFSVVAQAAIRLTAFTHTRFGGEK
jgi:hypothetical protein